MTNLPPNRFWSTIPALSLLISLIAWSADGTSAAAAAKDEAPAAKADAPAAAPAWRSLPLITDGAVDKTWAMLGWGGFVVEGDTLRAAPDERGMGLLVYTREKLGNCRIRIVYRAKDAKCNSGVYVRIDPDVLKRLDDKAPAVKRDEKGKLSKEELQKLMDASDQERGAWWPVHHGYEVQICETGDDLHRTGAIYSLAKAAKLPASKTDGWRTMIITLHGERVSVNVDGKDITSFDAAKALPATRKWTEPKREPKRPAEGYIGLQSHDPGDIVWFKEVSVQPLP